LKNIRGHPGDGRKCLRFLGGALITERVISGEKNGNIGHCGERNAIGRPSTEREIIGFATRIKRGRQEGYSLISNAWEKGGEKTKSNRPRIMVE